MVVMGRVRAPHGIKGWIKVQPFTQEVDGLLAYPEWWLGRNGDWSLYRIAEAAVHGDIVVARLAGFEDREAAAVLKGAEVAIPRPALPESREGEFYWNDLLGVEVLNVRGESLGRIAQLLETGANQVLVVRGEKETLIPFIKDVIVNVDLGGRRVLVDWERES
jgi:16S rRNA processing protein RimM